MCKWELITYKKKMSNEIKCLFGYHKYTIPWKENRDILICEVCKRVGYYEYPDGYEVGFEIWYDFNEKGNMIHRKWSDGDEVWYNEKGNMIHRKYTGGYEEWFDGKKWVEEKPKDWKYEECLNTT